MPVRLAEANVTIVGLGLMGGSLAAALSGAGLGARPACREVVGVARRQSTLAMASDLRFIQRGTSDLAEGVREADVVVLATPVRDILAKLETIGPLLKPGCLVMDVGSTKQAVCEAMARLPEGVQPLGGHPMCGKESSGLTMAEPDLYRGKVFVLAPLERTSEEALEMGRALALAVGGMPLVLDAVRHDRLVAAISHLPYLLAVALVQATESLAEEDDLVWRLAASGFRDTSRVAAGDITMMMDILTTNREAVLASLDRAQAQLDDLRRLVAEVDVDGLKAHLQRARNRRREMFR
ncbi:MAG: prephenate dehydrogenase [Anaerolineae bacterium]